MPTQEAPDDEDVRQTYNFAPGYYGLVYRAQVAPSSDRPEERHPDEDTKGNSAVGGKESPNTTSDTPGAATGDSKPVYTLQAMKWGLVPFWTKRDPGYSSFRKTINCRDDSLANAGGLWQHVKQRKRCVIVAQGFYEWLKPGKSRSIDFRISLTHEL